MAKKEKSVADVLPPELVRAFDEWRRLARELRAARTPSEIHALREQKAAYERMHGPHAKDLFQRAEAYFGSRSDDNAGIVMKDILRINNVPCEPALWRSFGFERNSKTSPARELLIHTFVNMSAPADLSNREVVKLIAENAGLPIESLSDALDRPVFSRSRVIYGFLGDALDEIARDYVNMQWWLSEKGLKMAILESSNPERAPTFDELTEGLRPSLPAKTSRTARLGKRDPVVQKIKKKVRDLRAAKLNYSSICDKLGSFERPPHASWRDLPWPRAYLKHTGAVTKWLSEACSERRP